MNSLLYLLVYEAPWISHFIYWFFMKISSIFFGFIANRLFN